MKTSDISPEILAAIKAAVTFDPATGLFFWNKRDETSFLERPGKKQSSAASAFNKQFSGKPAFAAKTSHGYLNGSFLRHRFYAHQIAWFFHTGHWPTQNIDHINGDKTDNRPENLRDVATHINCRNSRRPITNTSGHVGVGPSGMKRKPWKALIMVNKRGISLGNFKTIEEAIAARNAASAIYEFTARHGS